MRPAAEHYENLLAPVYTWMAGGAEAAFSAGRADLDAVVRGGSLAVDLGAGFGMHAIPLARAGWRVLAVDSSRLLIGQLADFARGLQVTARCCDLLEFPDHLPTGARADLILCMGDTLTHLDSLDAVAELARAAAAHLSPGGRFVATFRDYSRLPHGEARFIPVRSDQDRILTCFIEESGDHVLVHDLLHERQGDAWGFRASCYRKIRLAPESARRAFERAGLDARVEAGPRGMVRLVADA